MPDRAARVDEVRAAAPLRVGPVTLLPIEHVVLRASLGGRGAWAFAAREPYALIVRDPRGLRVIALGPGEVSLDELRARIPGLDDRLAPP